MAASIAFDQLLEIIQLTNATWCFESCKWSFKSGVAFRFSFCLLLFLQYCFNAFIFIGRFPGTFLTIGFPLILKIFLETPF